MNDDFLVLAEILRCAHGLTSQVRTYTSAHRESLAARLALAHALGLCDQLHEPAADVGVSAGEPGPCTCVEAELPKLLTAGRVLEHPQGAWKLHHGPKVVVGFR